MEISNHRFIVVYEWKAKTRWTTIYALDRQHAMDVFTKSAPRASILKCYPRRFKEPRKTDANAPHLTF